MPFCMSTKNDPIYAFNGFHSHIDTNKNFILRMENIDEPIETSATYIPN